MDRYGVNAYCTRPTGWRCWLDSNEAHFIKVLLTIDINIFFKENLCQVKEVDQDHIV